MESWLARLRQDLTELEAGGLRRQVRPIHLQGRWVISDGKKTLNLAGNDYLGLIGDPRINAACARAVWESGAGSGASRLVIGHQRRHALLEERFARFKHAEAGLVFPTGYMANLAVLTGLAGQGDLVCIDKLSHASLIDAARLSGATVRVYPHLGYEKLDRLLARHAGTGGPGTRFIVTDSVFSMDGDTSDLAAVCDIAERHGAVPIVDEAHGTGVLGDSGAGLCELLDVEERVGVVVSTASKALGCLGGIVTSKRVVIDALINRARPFIYTTAAPPGQVAAIDAALDVIDTEPWRRTRLAELSTRLRRRLADLGWGVAPSDAGPVTPIVPLVVGEATDALALSGHLEREGFFAPAIRPPTVPRGGCRVRLSLRADLEDGEVDRLVKALAGWRRG